MRFLVDANLSPVVASALRDAAHDAVHVVDLGLVTADDHRILDAAAQDDRVILTADADFGALLALGGPAKPSVVLLRSADHLGPPEQGALVLATCRSSRLTSRPAQSLPSVVDGFACALPPGAPVGRRLTCVHGHRRFRFAESEEADEKLTSRLKRLRH